MSLANSLSPTSLTKVYLALNSLSTRPTGHWDFASSADPGQVNLTILLAAAFSADLSLPDFQPIAHVMAAHVAIRVPQVYSSKLASLKCEPGPARVVGRPLGSRYFYVLAYMLAKNLKGGWGARRLSTAGAFTPPAAICHRFSSVSPYLFIQRFRRLATEYFSTESMVSFN